MDNTPSKQATARKSVGLFILAIVLVLSVRWIFYEPFVIPSGSMIPTLLINDHIVVTKFTYGIRLPFTNKWIVKPHAPDRGDVVVFRSVEREDYFMIKRVIGLPGDKIEFTDEGVLKVNGEAIKHEPSEAPAEFTTDDLGDGAEELQFFRDQTGDHKHISLLETDGYRYTQKEHLVPEGHIFLMGDNRDRSRDSRFWGDLPLENLLGRAQYVWLSCSKTLSTVNFVCDPRHIRWQRFFHRIE